ncbi:methyltransferase-like protein 2 [Pocillopora damicornis]|uniref:methyltransferase-like protein 2 n=1 Tax=Pocillopora damicornis TaxID=46731 RepID=UPI000F556909|nr:methyltransferase-like protein 2 [Pocillopora damicornis]
MADGADCSRPQFGNRFLSDPAKVFEHNAWDNVEWDSEQEKAAQQKIDENSCIKLGEDEQALFEDKAGSFWDEFYMQHQNRFFKDRHWLFTEFPELSGPETPDQGEASRMSRNNLSPGNETQPSTDSKNDSAVTEMTDNELTSSRHCVQEYPGCGKKKQILEVGCGVGNTVFPILEANNDPTLFVYCCDFSSNAINLVKEHPDYSEDRCLAFVCDITDSSFVFPFPNESLDIIILIFVLSAVHPDKMPAVICRLSKLLKPGGLILFRDYGRYDMAQLRFKKGKCLSDNFYVRGDGTRVYFFTQDELSQMFQEAGLVEEQNYVDRRLQVNRGRQLKMYRIWIQCKYRKPR